MVKRNNRKNGIVAFLLPLEFTAVQNLIYSYKWKEKLQSIRVKRKERTNNAYLRKLQWYKIGFVVKTFTTLSKIHIPSTFLYHISNNCWHLTGLYNLRILFSRILKRNVVESETLENSLANYTSGTLIVNK